VKGDTHGARVKCTFSYLGENRVKYNCSQVSGKGFLIPKFKRKSPKHIPSQHTIHHTMVYTNSRENAERSTFRVSGVVYPCPGLLDKFALNARHRQLPCLGDPD